MAKYVGWHKDPAIMEAQRKWHDLRQELLEAGDPIDGPIRHRFELHNAKLTKMLWDSCEADVREDRRLHPKKKRNLPVGSEVRK